jgi:hypothetical protein
MYSEQNWILDERIYKKTVWDFEIPGCFYDERYFAYDYYFIGNYIL